ncbi:single-stranded DNA-binding protein [Winkia sp. UMB3158]|jgi:single-strand DNA-binding protein|uniref:Single-stranded DNA-binding protein n=2 Tax=Actinomycetaceae TaxID=2049 RepID=A0AB38XPR4_9ACTO|nr:MULTISPECIES: single-stranded DNA-binding protein [Terrabacteria group]MDK8340968.1 single-stranded DNA-binding protein [Winkia sp. UMB3164B]OFT54407.1 hypothetical protein HMPREF3152_07960 [Actinomyces sp. HMSC06A08]KWZ75468.1 single-strand binding family protein [Winkia neuii]MDK6241378.1 single-stranded DNA-binding protein [Winkia sp. UMB10116]MDK6300906.1 single-stranded DNA-binding protein [Streptococcus agalactiae]
MQTENTFTISGNLTRDPETRYTQTGAAVTTITIAATPRQYNKQTGQFENGPALFIRCTAWRQLAENITDQLTKGQRVIATGHLKQDTYTDKTGAQRTSIEMQLEDIGPSLKFATRGAQTPPQAQGTYQAPAGGQQGDPWAQPNQPAQGFDQNPPF